MRWLGDEGAEKTNLTLDLIDSTTETSQKQMRTHFKKLYKILNADISYFVCLKLKCVHTLFVLYSMSQKHCIHTGICSETATPQQRWDCASACGAACH